MSSLLDNPMAIIAESVIGQFPLPPKKKKEPAEAKRDFFKCLNSILKKKTLAFWNMPAGSSEAFLRSLYSLLSLEQK